MTTQTELVPFAPSEESLILDGENEKVMKAEREVMAILNNFQNSNLTAAMKERMDWISDIFAHMFVRKSWDVLGASMEQLKRLTSAQLKMTDKILAQKSRKLVICQYGLVGLLALIPIIGWLAILVIFDDGEAYSDFSINLYRLRKKLQKAYGDDYFPEERIGSLIGQG